MTKYKHFILITIAILPLFIASHFLFLKDPPIWPDEFTSLYQAKTLLQTGKMHAYIYGGVPIESKRAGVAFPPVYFATLGAWTNVFGESIEAVRSLSLFLGVICVILFYFVIKLSLRANYPVIPSAVEGSSKKKIAVVVSLPRDDRLLPFFGALLLSFSVTFAKATRFGRPEIITMLFFLTSLFFLYRSRKCHDKIPLLLAYLFAAIATAAHPMGILAIGIIALAILFSNQTIRQKFLFSVWTGICFIISTASWILITQESVPDFFKAFQLGIKDKSYSIDSLIVLTSSDPLWSALFMGQWIILLILVILALKSKTDRTENMFIVSAALLSLVWVNAQKVIYYTVYTQPAIIIAIIAVAKRVKPIHRFGIIVFFIILNISLQFFNINSYTPAQSIFTIDTFNYHEFTKEIKNNLPPSCHPERAKRVEGSHAKRGKCTLFVASIPDPSIDLQTNPNYTIHLAIDPNYTLDLEDYKKTLDNTDYIIYTWLPHDFLANYLDANAENIETITQEDGYTAQIAKLKPRKQRQ